MAYKHDFIEKGIPVPTSYKGTGKWPAGIHPGAKVASRVDTDGVTVLVLVLPAYGTLSQLISTTELPHILQRGDEVVAEIIPTAGVVFEQHPAEAKWRAIDSLTKKEVVGYTEDTAKLASLKEASTRLASLAFNHRNYSFTEL